MNDNMKTNLLDPELNCNKNFAKKPFFEWIHGDRIEILKSIIILTYFNFLLFVAFVDHSGQDQMHFNVLRLIF